MSSDKNKNDEIRGEKITHVNICLERIASSLERIVDEIMSSKLEEDKE